MDVWVSENAEGESLLISFVSLVRKMLWSGARVHVLVGARGLGFSAPPPIPYCVWITLTAGFILDPEYVRDYYVLSGGKGYIVKEIG